MQTPEQATLSGPTAPRLVILISGRGSNMRAIVQAARAQHWPATIAAVVAHRDTITGVAIARELGLPVRIVPLPEGLTRAEQDRLLRDGLDALAPDWVVLAGYMRILSSEFVAHFRGRLVNIHPSLLPAFPGLRTHRQALDAGVKVHGATVHLVTAELDSGPILAQAVVPVLPGDDEARLAERVLEAEHRLYPVALRGLVENRIRIDGRRARWESEPARSDPLLLLPEPA